MPIPTLRQDNIAEAYEDLRKLVYNITHKFAARYCIPFDDIISHSHLSFVRAFDSFKLGKGSTISTWVSFCLYNDLTSYLIKEYRHRDYSEINEETCGATCHSTFLVDFMDCLEEDAREVVRLVLDPPSALSRKMHHKSVRTSSQLLREVRNHLIAQGWDRIRVSIAMDEVVSTLRLFGK